ncbi:hypothetical protein D3C71_2107150 [compost metagenome]
MAHKGQIAGSVYEISSTIEPHALQQSTVEILHKVAGFLHDRGLTLSRDYAKVMRKFS